MERIQLFISRFELTGIRDRDILTLSGGQRQLVSLAAALISEPGLLLLDEPLSMIDRHDREVMLATLSEIVSPETSVIFATNRFSEVQDFERFVLIGRQRKLFDGNSKELRESLSVFAEAEMTIPFEISVSC
jgi:energy-coupling factor transporter ATP-binding protein EcfA2